MKNYNSKYVSIVSTICGAGVFAVAVGLGFYGLNMYTDQLIEKVSKNSYTAGYKIGHEKGYEKCKNELKIHVNNFISELRNENELELALLTEKRLRAIMKRSNPELSDDKQRQYIKYITKYSKEYGISPILVASVIHRESNFRIKLTSSVGAAGPMQVWSKWHNEKLKRNNITKDDLYSIEHGVKIGCEVLQEYIKWEKGDFRAALYRYVGGQHHGYVRDIFAMCDFAFKIK